MYVVMLFVVNSFHQSPSISYFNWVVFVEECFVYKVSPIRTGYSVLPPVSYIVCAVWRMLSC